MSLRKVTFTVELSIDRGAWRNLGYGDQPSKSEVRTEFILVAEPFLDNHNDLPTVVQYLGAPGKYRVTQSVYANGRWYERTSKVKARVEAYYRDQVTRFAKHFTYTAV